MDEKTYNYMSKRTKDYEAITGRKKNLGRILDRIDDYPNCECSVNIQGVYYNVPRNFSDALKEYVAKEIKCLESKIEEI